MNTKHKINLSILNKLVEALNLQNTIVENLSEKTSQEEYIVEISKVLGIVSAAQVESSALIQDIMSLIKLNSVPEVELSAALDMDLFNTGRPKSVKN